MLIAIALVMGVLLIQPTEKTIEVTQITCHQTIDTTMVSPSQACLSVEKNSSWGAWLMGESRSAQFHYLDLLELLTSSRF
jgi:hypothetical protein